LNETYYQTQKHTIIFQGLNRLAAIALLFLSEEDAFWCLVAIVDHILPAEYFSTTLMAAQADQVNTFWALFCFNLTPPF